MQLCVWWQVTLCDPRSRRPSSDVDQPLRAIQGFNFYKVRPEHHCGHGDAQWRQSNLFFLVGRFIPRMERDEDLSSGARVEFLGRGQRAPSPFPTS